MFTRNILLYSYGTVVLWYRGIMVPIYRGTMILNYHCIVAAWYSSTKMPLCPGIVVLYILLEAMMKHPWYRGGGASEFRAIFRKSHYIPLETRKKARVYVHLHCTPWSTLEVSGIPCLGGDGGEGDPVIADSSSRSLSANLSRLSSAQDKVHGVPHTRRLAKRGCT